MLSIIGHWRPYFRRKLSACSARQLACPIAWMLSFSADLSSLCTTEYLLFFWFCLLFRGNVPSLVQHWNVLKTRFCIAEWSLYCCQKQVSYLPWSLSLLIGFSAQFTLWLPTGLGSHLRRWKGETVALGKEQATVCVETSTIEVTVKTQSRHEGRCDPWVFTDQVLLVRRWGKIALVRPLLAITCSILVNILKSKTGKFGKELQK